jgi:hypothetical protein
VADPDRAETARAAFEDLVGDRSHEHFTRRLAA